MVELFDPAYTRVPAPLNTYNVSKSLRKRTGDCTSVTRGFCYVYCKADVKKV
jgi:hypothetical protein